MVCANWSPNTVTASGKEIPCLERFDAAFRSSQENRIGIVYRVPRFLQLRGYQILADRIVGLQGEILLSVVFARNHLCLMCFLRCWPGNKLCRTTQDAPFSDRPDQ
jgi:hypothetical protein